MPPRESKGPPTPGRRVFRMAQVAIYLAFAVGVFVYGQYEATAQGRMAVLTYLLSFYMAARALAIWIKFRQETSRSRYSRAYADVTEPDETPGTEDPKDGGHG